MKLAIIFEVPDGQADAYADVAARLIQHHQFAEQQGIKHWSFDQEMRPFAAALIPESVLTDQVEAADALAALLTEQAEAPTLAGRLDELHDEAKREDLARRLVAAAGESWDTHMAKFDGTVLERPSPIKPFPKPPRDGARWTSTGRG